MRITVAVLRESGMPMSVNLRRNELVVDIACPGRNRGTNRPDRQCPASSPRSPQLVQMCQQSVPRIDAVGKRKLSDIDFAFAAAADGSVAKPVLIP